MRRALASFMSTAGVAGLLTVAASTASAAETCPNQSFRTGLSAALSDCRAYELVSPPAVQPYFETFGFFQNVAFAGAIFGAELGTTASQNSLDSGIAFFSTVAEPSSPTDGPDYLSIRGPAGWATKNLIPPQSTEISVGCLPYMIAWSANLERGVLADGLAHFNENGDSGCGFDEPGLVPGESREGTENLFVRDSSADTYRLINQAGLLGEPANAVYQGGSSDLGVIAFSEVPRAAAKSKYYVWAGGTDRLLTVLPNGEATEGQIANAAVKIGAGANGDPTSPTFSHAVAPDGSRIEFSAGGNLYSRVNPGAPQSAFDEAGECDEPAKACTVQLDSSESVVPGGGGVFEGGSGEDGSVVYFTDANRLTSDSTATAEAPDLYEYDFHKPGGERLRDITVDQTPGEHADVLGYVGTNENGVAGEWVYFVATGVLASNEDSAHASAVAGKPNLYVAHRGVTTFVATLAETTDSCDWENRCMSARVSSNGRYLGFDSLEELTGVNNVDANSGTPDQNIFLYDGGEDELSCVSCGTSGVAPVAPASIRLPEGVFINGVAQVLYLQRNVSDNGQVFFDTPNPLLPGARSGGELETQSNVYEYQAGELHLLSAGPAETSSFFYEASPDGRDVYLVTSQVLTPGASSVAVSIYDAKVDGGFSSPAASNPEPCSGEGCSGPQAPGVQPPPVISSASLFGQGNLEPVVPKPATVRSLTSVQKLAKALKSCRAKRNRHKRGVCEAQARKRYGPHLKKSAKTNRRDK
jgi:hypothetical protein